MGVKWKSKKRKISKTTKKETEISHTDTPEINEVSQAVPIMCDKRLEDKNEENKFSLSLLTFQANFKNRNLRTKTISEDLNLRKLRDLNRDCEIRIIYLYPLSQN